LARARAAFDGSAWSATRSGYAEVGDRATLTALDLEQWGLAALLTGHDDEATALREQAHYRFMNDGDVDGAARVAFWLGLSLRMRGELAQANGWFSRMRSVFAADRFEASRWRGYELVNDGMAALFARDFERSMALLEEAMQIAAGHDDVDLRLLAANGHGQALLALGRLVEGMSELDEVMVTATTGAANPQAVGLVYCAVISVCRDSLDVSRSVEWTEVLGRWCDAQPDLVPYRGQCLVHRSEVLQVSGHWVDAAREVDAVLDRLGMYTHDVAAGMALYQRGELHRLRGEFAAAERGYREALAAGHDPQPGLALLRLAEGKPGVALLSLHRSLDETPLVFARARLLPAVVEVAVEAGDLESGRAAVAELEECASRLDSVYLRGAAAAARAGLALVESRPSESIAAARQALRRWAGLNVPYEIARCRVLLARACHALGDHETAQLELDAARATFVRLGAAYDVGRLDDLVAGPRPSPDGLTPREVEVLRLVATGASNRDIADRLVLSERTVARHVANIFVKIGVSARAAATAYAYDHRLV
jgi:DNA-binding NarL/FixJ family response regulator